MQYNNENLGENNAEHCTGWSSYSQQASFVFIYFMQNVIHSLDVFIRFPRWVTCACSAKLKTFFLPHTNTCSYTNRTTRRLQTSINTNASKSLAGRRANTCNQAGPYRQLSNRPCWVTGGLIKHNAECGQKTNKRQTRPFVSCNNAFQLNNIKLRLAFLL